MIENIKALLRHADEFEWSLQGFGMFRTYFAEEFRVHLWDLRFAAPGVSTVHTHPWHFKSTVVAGRLRNVIYGRWNAGETTHHMQKILCGPGGGLVDEPYNVRLEVRTEREYLGGTSYMQRATDLHETIPEQGTVTTVTRNFLPDTEHAYVCWPLGTEWGTAEPRPATREEIRTAAAYALERWFS